jgi:hypothetical protein
VENEVSQVVCGRGVTPCMVLRNERKFGLEKHNRKAHLGNPSINRKVNPKELAFQGNDWTIGSNSIFLSRRL